MSHVMWPESVERVSTVLRGAAVESRIQEFETPTPSAPAAAEAIGCDLSQIVKSLVFVCDGAYVLALVPGDRRADEDKIRGAVEARTVRIATVGEVERATGFRAGAVAPFPQRAIAHALMESTLLQHETVWIGAGSTVHMAAIAPGDLQKLARARTADLVGRG